MNTLTENRPTQKQSKAKVTGYWIVTGFIVFELLYGASWDFNLLNKGYVYDVLKHLGYPLYLASILAVCKVVAAVVILLPGLPLLKEWAYAGVVILFMGGFVSHLIVGDGPGQFIWSFLFGLLALASWKLNYRNESTTVFTNRN